MGTGSGTNHPTTQTEGYCPVAPRMAIEIIGVDDSRFPGAVACTVPLTGAAQAPLPIAANTWTSG